MADPFTQMMMGQGTSFGGSPFPQMPMLNFGQMIPGMGGQGGMGMFLNFAMMSMLNPYMQQQGMFGMQFMGNQNIYDTMAATRQFMDRQMMMQTAAAHDSAQLGRIFTGFARMQGVSDAELAIRQPAYQRAAEAVGPMLPFLSMMAPDAVDKFFGNRGAALTMIPGMMQGARFQLDPVTGGVGLTGETASRFTTQLHSRLMSDPTFMKGLTTGQVGGMYDEMARRGMLGSLSMREIEAGQAAGGVGGITGIGGAAMRESQLTAQTERMKSLAGAVKAMKELFGENGNPDAPMPQIFNALQAITQGSMASMNPGQVEHMVRQLQMATRHGGMSLGNALQYTAAISSRMQAEGMSGATASAITADAIAATRGFADVIGNMPGFFGRMDTDKFMRVESQLRAGAAASPLNQRLNAIQAMADRLKGNANFEGSDLAQLSAAIASGQETFANGRSVMVSTDELQKMYLAAGGTQEGFYAQMQAKSYNERFQQRDRTDVLARNLQSRIDMAPIIANTFGSRFERAGMDRGLGNRMFDALRNVDRKRFFAGNESDRADAVIAALEAQGPLPAGTDRARLKEAIMNGSLELSQLMQEMKLSGMSPIGNLEEFMQMEHKDVREAAMRRRRFDIMAAETSGALSGLGQQDPLRRIFQTFATGENMTIEEAIVKTFGGGVTGEQAKKWLQKAESGGYNIAGMADKLKRAMDPNTPEKERKKLLGELDKELGPAIKALTAAGDNYGLVSAEDMRNAELGIMGPTDKELGAEQFGPSDEELGRGERGEGGKVASRTEITGRLEITSGGRPIGEGELSATGRATA